MNTKINRMYELTDDYQDCMFKHNSRTVRYAECYCKKIFVNGFEYNAFVIEGQSFYDIELTHVPREYNHFVLDIGLSMIGLIYNYNPVTKQLFIYNTTQNNIYIQKDDIIGEFYD